MLSYGLFSRNYGAVGAAGLGAESCDLVRKDIVKAILN